MRIESEKELRDMYGVPGERAKNKQLSSLEKHSTHFIQTSPFVVISTADRNGNLDASPRGGDIGFVKILNEQTIVLPDFKGNNRLDSILNIVNSGRIGLLFFIPGVDETLRVNGSAHISTNTELLQLFPNEKNPPQTCIVIEVEEVFMHCAKAFMRSGLWNSDMHIDKDSFPSMGEILKDQLGSTDEAESREDMVKRYQKDM